MLYLFAQAIIGLFFIVTGVFNIRYFKQQVDKLKQTIIPQPVLAVIVAIVLQIGGGCVC